jgi:hypothetical protein
MTVPNKLPGRVLEFLSFIHPTNQHRNTVRSASTQSVPVHPKKRLRTENRELTTDFFPSGALKPYVGLSGAV